jgi:PAS domain S-box-containing protein
LNVPGPVIQTLEDLRKSADAAWLWDGMRGRLVWANAPGIQAFDGQSVFDLIDRVFDPEEPGITDIASLTKTLKRDELRQVSLEFPSTGRSEPIHCFCSIHTLADGRPGLLVVAPRPIIDQTETHDLFGQFPVAALQLEQDGRFIRANAMARTLFDVNCCRDLAGLLGGAEQSNKILRRLQSVHLVSSIECFQGLFGQREARLTLRRLTDESGPYAILVMEDITERRNMERQLSEISAPAPVAENAKQQSGDEQAFAALARSLNDAIRGSEAQSDKPKTEKETAVAKVQPTQVVKHTPAAQPPLAIVNAFENSGVAILIVQNSEVVFASKKALQLFDVENLSALQAQNVLYQSILNSKLANSHVTLQNATGQPIHLRISENAIPWINGPARQINLHIAKIVEEKVASAATMKELPLPEVPEVKEANAAQETQVIAERPAAESTHGAEDELRTILDIASDGIVTLDKVGNILSFSAGAESLFGYRSAEVKGKPLAEYFTPESRKVLKQYLAGLQGPGLGAVFNDGREVMAVVKQGGTVPLFLTIGKLQAGKSSAAFCAVMRDITTWKRSEKELREAKENAEAASKQKSEFLARISHELRTPLNAIMGFSDVMRLGQFGEIQNEKYRGYVNDIHASGGHLLALINDLLDLSKIEAGKMELNFTAVNIADCADHAIKLLQDSATRGRVLVRKSFPDKLPRVVADLRAMRQVMLNLLSNAIKFTDPGGQVIISAAVSASGELTLKMKDTGIGMNTAQMQDALEPFKRVETTGRETQGTGLGLPLTKALVEANRAKFTLSSERGQGTLIEITFPTTRVLAE